MFASQSAHSSSRQQRRRATTVRSSGGKKNRTRVIWSFYQPPLFSNKLRLFRFLYRIYIHLWYKFDRWCYNYHLRTEFPHVDVSTRLRYVHTFCSVDPRGIILSFTNLYFHLFTFFYFFLFSLCFLNAETRARAFRKTVTWRKKKPTRRLLGVPNSKLKKFPLGGQLRLAELKSTSSSFLIYFSSTIANNETTGSVQSRNSIPWIRHRPIACIEETSNSRSERWRISFRLHLPNDIAPSLVDSRVSMWNETNDESKSSSKNECPYSRWGLVRDAGAEGAKLVGVAAVSSARTRIYYYYMLHGFVLVPWRL